MRTIASDAIVGTWIGACAMNQHWVYLEAHFTTEAFTLTGTIDMHFVDLRWPPQRRHDFRHGYVR